MVRCNQYASKADANRPSLHQMEQMAYILTEIGPLKGVGFIQPKEWRKRNKGDDVVPFAPDYD